MRLPHKAARAGSRSGTRLAQNIGARVGDTITIINPQGRSTPFGTSIRQVGYEVGAIFEVGIYDYDEKFVVLPIRERADLAADGRFDRHDRSHRG